LDATTDDIEKYLDSRHVQAKTRYVNLSHFHAFYRWAVREGLIDVDPTERIDRPQLPSYVPRPIGDADLVYALSVAPADVRAMLTLACFAGLRCGEIAGLQRTDILDRHRPAMLVVTAPKGHRQRTVPLHADVWRALEAYGLPRRGSIFRNRDGRQLSPWQISHTVSQYLRGIGVDATCHQGRHWFGSTLYANTKDIRLVQEMLGHTDPKTTAVYTAFSPGAAHRRGTGPQGVGGERALFVNPPRLAGTCDAWSRQTLRAPSRPVGSRGGGSPVRFPHGPVQGPGGRVPRPIVRRPSSAGAFRETLSAPRCSESCRF
jgi:site-specific recombinase XerD